MHSTAGQLGQQRRRGSFLIIARARNVDVRLPGTIMDQPTEITEWGLAFTRKHAHRRARTDINVRNSEPN